MRAYLMVARYQRCQNYYFIDVVRATGYLLLSRATYCYYGLLYSKDGLRYSSYKIGSPYGTGYHAIGALFWNWLENKSINNYIGPRHSDNLAVEAVLSVNLLIYFVGYFKNARQFNGSPLPTGYVSCKKNSVARP